MLPMLSLLDRLSEIREFRPAFSNCTFNSFPADAGDNLFSPCVEQPRKIYACYHRRTAQYTVFLN